MRYRIAGWALAGFLIAAFWAVYLFTTFHLPISREIESVARLTCPIALVGEHYHRGASPGLGAGQQCGGLWLAGIVLRTGTVAGAPHEASLGRRAVS